jgi:hypothetical protein
MKDISSNKPSYKKAGATSYRVFVQGTEIGRVGRMPGNRWCAEAIRNDQPQDAGDFWASRDAAARACVYFDA